MKKNRTSCLSLLIFLGCLVLVSMAPVVLAAQQTKEKTTATDVKEKATATYEALKKYTLEQKDEAVASADEKLKELDTQIAEIQKNLDERWQKMSEATRQKTQESLQELRKEREKVAEWYGGMRHSSAQAWEIVKKGFADSYDRLEQSLAKAKKDFESKD